MPKAYVYVVGFQNNSGQAGLACDVLVTNDTGGVVGFPVEQDGRANVRRISVPIQTGQITAAAIINALEVAGIGGAGSVGQTIAAADVVILTGPIQGA